MWGGVITLGIRALGAPACEQMAGWPCRLSRGDPESSRRRAEMCRSQLRGNIELACLGAVIHVSYMCI